MDTFDGVVYYYYKSELLRGKRGFRLRFGTLFELRMAEVEFRGRQDLPNSILERGTD